MGSRNKAGDRSPLHILGIALLTVLLIGMVGCTSESGKARGSVLLAEAQRAYESGDFAESEGLLQEVLESAPSSLEARQTLALALAAQGKNREAIEQYGKIVQARPKDHACWYRMAVLERILGDAGRAEAHLEKALALQPRDPGYTDEFARIKMSLGCFDEAAVLWGSLLEGEELSEEGRKEVLILQGQAYQEAEDDARAKKAYKAALKLDPSDAALGARVEAFD